MDASRWEKIGTKDRKGTKASISCYCCMWSANCETRTSFTAFCHLYSVELSDNPSLVVDAAPLLASFWFYSRIILCHSIFRHPFVERSPCSHYCFCAFYSLGMSPSFQLHFWRNNTLTRHYGLRILIFSFRNQLNCEDALIKYDKRSGEWSIEKCKLASNAFWAMPMWLWIIFAMSHSHGQCENARNIQSIF